MTGADTIGCAANLKTVYPSNGTHIGIFHNIESNTRFIFMQRLTSFFLFCSGADPELLKKCPTETSKYTGIGATVFFTGLFAALSAGYALYTVFDSWLPSSIFGLVWGLMIFNLDRYIVSSMRKEGRASRELIMASPRIMLAILISIVIARPLELKIFDKEIQPELIVIEQEKFAQQERLVNQRFQVSRDSMKREVETLHAAIATKAQKRDELVRLAQEEADGTGGSRKRNLGPIYKIKKADADKAEAELQSLTDINRRQVMELESRIRENDEAMKSEISAIERKKIDGPAARIEALDRITKESAAVWWAHWFIVLLFIAIETAPVFVKLISSRGPYDNLLNIEERKFSAHEIEALAVIHAAVKERTSRATTA